MCGLWWGEVGYGWVDGLRSDTDTKTKILDLRRQGVRVVSAVVGHEVLR